MYQFVTGPDVEFWSVSDQIMHAYGMGALCKQASVRAPFIIIIEELNPDDDFAVLDSLRQLGTVPGYQPMTQRRLQSTRSEAGSFGQALCKRTSCARNALGVVGKREPAQFLANGVERRIGAALEDLLPAKAANVLRV